MIKAVFSDRDGVITKLVKRENSYHAPWYPDEIKYFPKIKEAIENAHGLGYKFFVVTNQPDLVAFQTRTYHKIKSFLIDECKIDDIISCSDRGNHNYKPNPGMIHFLKEKYDVDLSESWMIGDSWKDCICAALANVSYIHIGREDPLGPTEWLSDDLFSAIHYIKIKPELEKEEISG